MADKFTWDEREALQKQLQEGFDGEKHTVKILKNRSDEPGSIPMGFNLNYMIASPPKKEKPVYLMDDMCDTGGTVAESFALMRKLGVENKLK